MQEKYLNKSEKQMKIKKYKNEKTTKSIAKIWKSNKKA